MNRDFMTFFEKLSPEDRDTLIGNFLKNLNGEATESILIRKTFKISNQGTEEEIRQRIADVYGVSMDELPPMILNHNLKGTGIIGYKFLSLLHLMRHF